jgi:5-oxoprolinase (ATP-hydrolysing)/N-methylhydantoinase A
VARALGSREVLVPPVSGVASALGFLVAPAAFEFGRSRPAELEALDWAEVAELFADLEAEGLATVAGAGVPEPEVRLERSAEMRLTGQFHDIEVPVPNGPLDSRAAAPLREAFEREYRRRYHAVLTGYAPLVLNWRLRAVGPEPRVTVPHGAALLDGAARPPVAARPAYFPEAGGMADTPVLDRYALPVGARRDGPLIVEERESTTIVGPGDALWVDEAGNLRVRVGNG